MNSIVSFSDSKGVLDLLGLLGVVAVISIGIWMMLGRKVGDSEEEPKTN